MTLNEFLEEFQELLEVEDAITLETSLEELDEYDSLAIMSLIAFIDENFGMSVSGESLGKLETVSDLVALIGADKLD